MNGNKQKCCGIDYESDKEYWEWHRIVSYDKQQNSIGVCCLVGSSSNLVYLELPDGQFKLLY